MPLNKVKKDKISYRFGRSLALMTEGYLWLPKLFHDSKSTRDLYMSIYEIKKKGFNSQKILMLSAL